MIVEVRHGNSYLSERHDIMLDVRPGDSFWIFAVVCDYDCDSWIVLSDTVDQNLKFIIPQESLCSNGNQSADVIFCRRSDNKTTADI